jgi:hypothetical protein
VVEETDEDDEEEEDKEEEEDSTTGLTMRRQRCSAIARGGCPRKRHSDDATRYILYGDSLIKYTGRCQYNARGGCPRRGPVPPQPAVHVRGGLPFCFSID